MTTLERRWPSCVAARTDLRDELLAGYAEPHRAYHDTRHLTEVLDRLEHLLAEHPLPEAEGDAVVLAAWFHDAVYDGSRDDEERSAVLAESALAAAGVPPGVVTEVARLVRLTADHAPGEDDLAGQLLCDADLAILAAGRDRYDAYVRDVRREYAHLDDDSFRSGRAQVLRALLAKPTLFHTAHARSRWEEAARANLDRELSAPGPP